MKIIIWDQNNQDLKNTMSDGCSTVVQLVGLDGRVGWGREQIIVRFSKCSAAWQILPTTNCRPVCISFLCGWSQYILSHSLNIFGQWPMTNDHVLSTYLVIFPRRLILLNFVSFRPRCICWSPWSALPCCSPPYLPPPCHLPPCHLQPCHQPPWHLPPCHKTLGPQPSPFHPAAMELWTTMRRRTTIAMSHFCSESAARGSHLTR